MPSSSSDWTWSINNLAHTHSTGFWGPVEANHAFCEPHYAISHYIAEFFNSISSLVYILLGIYGEFPNDTYVKTAQVWLVLIGLGSIAFHGTMRYVMQLADEIPMVGFITTLILAKMNMNTMENHHPWLGSNKATTVANISVVVFAVALIAIYVLLDQYEVFVHGFSALSLFDAISYIPLLKSKRGTKWESLQTRSVVVAIVSILLGRVAWETEHALCPRYPQVWPLHVVWHFLSCLSAYGAMVSTYVLRVNSQADMPRFIGFDSLSNSQGEKHKVE